jgi:hypothetical protein
MGSCRQPTWASTSTNLATTNIPLKRKVSGTASLVNDRRRRLLNQHLLSEPIIERLLLQDQIIH